jgi:hypothetical protein
MQVHLVDQATGELPAAPQHTIKRRVEVVLNPLNDRRSLYMSTSTHAVLENHLKAFGEGIEAILADYTNDSIVITPDATYRGLAEIRDFFTAFVEALPEGLWDAFTMKRQEVVGEVAYILWEANPWFPLGTDTFVVREGKIAFQTFAAYAKSK